MPWGVEVTDQFEEWWDDLHEAEQDALDAAVERLETLGPALGRPLADTLKGSRHPNMKELTAVFIGIEPPHRSRSA